MFVKTTKEQNSLFLTSLCPLWKKCVNILHFFVFLQTGYWQKMVCEWNKKTMQNEKKKE